MEELNKTQIVLLTLLVSFVTSIATGIITVALMDDQAPAGVTQTINRVVERTIEKVGPEKAGQSAGVVMKEVVVKEENLITESIQKASASVVRIRKTVATETGTAEVLVSFGAILDKDGVVVADSSAVEDGVIYSVVFADDTVISAKKIGASLGVSYLKPLAKPKATLTPVKFANSDMVNLGQTAFMLYGRDKNVVSLGIIRAARKNEAGNNASFDADLAETEVYGNPVFSIYGEMIGVRLPATDGAYILPSNPIASGLASN
jgi:hypothetical protein